MTDFFTMFFNLEYMLKVLPDLVGVGLLNTLILAVAATAIALVIGMLVAMALISRHTPPFRNGPFGQYFEVRTLNCLNDGIACLA